MAYILLVGDAAGSVNALSAAIPATHSVRIANTGRSAVLAAAEGVTPALMLLADGAPVDLSIVDFVSMLGSLPATAHLSVARANLLFDGTAPPHVDWVTPPTPEAAQLAAGILLVYSERASVAYQAKARLRQRMIELSAKANRELIQYQVALQAAEWLNASPPLTKVVLRVMSVAEDRTQGLRQLRGQLVADAGMTLGAAEVERALEKLAEVLD